MLAGGSDWSVTSVNPLDAIQVAVTRKALEAPADAPAWLPGERLDLATALAAYTSGGAYVTFEEEDSGSLEVGKLADIIIVFVMGMICFIPFALFLRGVQKNA